MNAVSPLVSIVIPCYNDGKYLREAVDSALAQTYSNCEIIIVDDHSDDAVTLAALLQLAEEGLTVIRTPQGKKGLPAARNTGINQAKGTYIMPLDADDRLHPTYIEKACVHMEQNPDVCVCTAQVAFFGLKRGVWHHSVPASLWGFLSLQRPIVCSSLYHKASWEAAGGYNEGLILGHEDAAFWISLLEHGGRIVELPEVLFFYRVKGGSLTSRYVQPGVAEAAANALYNAHSVQYMQHAREFFLETRRLCAINVKQNALYSYKLLQPIMRLEWALRQCIKRFVGRA